MLSAKLAGPIARFFTISGTKGAKQISKSSTTENQSAPKTLTDAKVKEIREIAIESLVNDGVSIQAAQDKVDALW
ncbi:MAG: hypothetical protein KR126chlam5_01453 [Candidatus Anoxychlamydiales bacterium]|nr:hypothetical protein [Candidatus Anoxychlamydiales bacterium]